MLIQCDPKDFDAFLELIKPENKDKIQVFGVLEDGTLEEIKDWNDFILFIKSFWTIGLFFSILQKRHPQGVSTIKYYYVCSVI